MKHFISSLSVLCANTPPCEGRVSSRKILSLLLILFLSIGNAWGAETLYKNALFKSANCTNNSSYTGTVTCTIGADSWVAQNAANNNGGWDYVKIGAKKAKASDPTKVTTGTITTNAAYAEAVSKIVVNGQKDRGSFTSKLIIASNSSFTTDKVEITGATSFTNNQIVFEIASPSANKYYKLEFVCSNTTTSNGVIQVSSVEYYYEPGSEEPALSSIEIYGDLDNKTYEEGDELDLTGLTVQANYESGDPKDVTNDVEWSYEPLTAGQTSVTVTATYEEKTATKPIDGLTVNEHIVNPGAYTGDLNNTFFGCAVGNNATEQSGKFNDVLVLAGCKSSASSKTNYQSEHVRFYADSYLTISVPAGYVIKSIVFTADGTWNGSITASAGTYDNNSKTWTGNAQEVKFSFAQQNRIKSVKVTYAADVKYAVNITTPSNGTLVVKEGSTVLTDGALVYEGTKLVVTPTPVSGYLFESLTVGEEAVELTDGTYTFNMPAADVTISATFKENEKPAATLTLSKNGVEEPFPGSWKQDDVVTLPSITSDCVKEFVGWSANPTCKVAPEYAAGDSYTLTATAQTLYAVYATVDGGGETTASVNMATYATANSWGSTSSTNQKQITINSDVKAVISAGGNSGKYYNDGVRIYQSESATVTISTTVGELKSVKFTFTNSSDGTLLYGSTKLTSGTAVEVSGTSAVFSVGDTNASENKGQIRFTAIEVTYASAPTYSDYSTDCAAAPKAEVNPTEVTAIAAAVEGKVTVTYENVNTANVSVALFNDEACTEAFSADWLTASLDDDKNVTYTVAATTLYTERKAYIQLTAPETTGATDPAVVVIPVIQAGKDKVFASLAELVAADLAKDDAVTVTLTNDVIKEFYIYNSKRAGVVFDVQKDGKDIKIYFNNQTTIDNWVVGGKLSGTLTNVKWTTYSSAWQLAPANTWAWANLTYTEPKAVSTVVVSGAPTKTTYVDGEAFDPAGLTVTVNYNDATSEVNPTGVTFDVTPATLVKGQTSVSVTATYNSVTSAAYEVTGLTVNDIPTKTVAEFIAAGGTRCYLEGIVSNITNTTYGNFDLTDASGTIYVYGCLNAAGEEQKFADLGVKEGDKIKVIADVYELYQGTKQEAKNVQYVSHISAATITIADITMEVGETKTIAATVVPAEAGVTYTIKENAANAISLDGKTITALAEGTATITASVAEGATYLGNSVDFTVKVTPKTNKVVILAEREGQWYALKAEYLSGKTDRLVAVPVDYFNGILYNVAEEVKATIEWNSIVEGDKVSFLNDGKYLKGKTSTTLIFEAGEEGLYQWDKDDFTMVIEPTERTFLYNGEAFRNFATSNAGQTKDGITYSSLPVVTAPVYSTEDFVSVYTRTVTPDNYGTICLPYASDNFTGATFFKVAGKEGNKIVFDEVAALEAGKPYIFLAEATEIKVAQIGTEELTAQRHNSLQGTFTQINPAVDNVLVNNYMVVNNVIKKCGVNCGLKAYRAYFIAAELETLGTPSAPVPGRRRVAIGQAPQVATGVDQVQGDNVPAKMIINGQLFILRGEKMYDAQGKLVK